MKNQFLVRILASWLAVALLSQSLAAQTCPRDGGEPQKPYGPIVFESREGIAKLIGFSEFSSPSTPAKKYLRKEVSGDMMLGFWPQTGCPGPTSGRGDWQASGTYTEGTLTWGLSASLTPETYNATTITYRARVGPCLFTHPPYVVIPVVAGAYIALLTGPIGVANLYDGQTVTLPKGGSYYAYMYYWQSPLDNGYIAPTYGAFDTGSAITNYRDEWDQVQEYDPADPAGMAFVANTDNSVRYKGYSGAFPMSQGGDASGAPSATDYNGFITEELTSTARTLSATGSCMAATGGSRKVQGAYMETLSKEDTENDASNRAKTRAANVTTPGSSNTAFETTLDANLQVTVRTVQFKAPFKVDCPGDYDIHITYSVKPHGASGPVTTETVITRRRIESGERTVEGPIKVDKKDTDYTLVSIELHEPACGDEPPGHPEITVHSVKVGLSLGRGASSINAGQLRLDAESITTALYSPAALTAVTAEGNSVEIVRDAGVLRQLKAPQTLADIVTLDASSYEVRFYAPSDVGAQDASTKIYTLGGTPYVVYKFENPDAAQSLTTRLRITETRGSIVRVSEYSYASATNTLSLSSGNSLRKEALTIATVSGDTVKTTTISDANDEPVSKTAKTYHTFAWGEELVSAVLDPDGAALTTSYEFYSDAANDGGAYGHLKQRVNSNGPWERYTYDATGRTLKTIRPFLDAAVTAAENLCRVTESSYSTLADADGDAIPEQLTTTIESTLGQETGRSHRIEWSKSALLGGEFFTRRTDIRCVTAGAAWNDEGNLVSETLLYAVDPYVGRVRRTVNPDGTAFLASYSLDASGEQTAIVKTGTPNSAKDDIVDGTRTVTFTSAQGQVSGESTSDIVSTLTLSSWTATQFDAVGRPTRFDYPDGTYETKDYACCGLSSSRDRAGLTTSFLYDDLGRQTDATSNGITIHTDYDADGRVKSVTRIGTDNSAMVQSTSKYDRAGRLTEQRDALNRLTTYSETFDATTGHTTRTTTNPDLGTRVVVSARDGSPLTISGTAAAPHNYDYGVESGLLYAKDTLVGPEGATTEWVKSYTDFAGRSFKIVYADNASTQSYFNTIGQLVRQVDPDGVTTLFGYNARGEQDTMAVDLDGNNAIDLAGTDRVTSTVNEVVNRDTYVVRRTTTKVYETDGSGTPTTISVTEAATDGLHSWHSTLGSQPSTYLTTSSVTTLDGSGGRTVTTTGPDGVQTIQVYTGNLLTSVSQLSALNSQLGQITYGYDPHHRLQTSTDARTGATTYSYYADDQIHTVLTPDPDTSRSGDGYDPQTTTFTYNSAGRVDTVTQPDNTVVNTTYYLTGAVKRTWGSRTYPTEYTYDPQGRVKTLTTWQNFASATGAAVTTWNYNPQRGWLDNKRFADNTGPSYTFKPSGRLHTRVWARTPAITTTYSYTVAGDIEEVDYSDSTPDVGMTYDRSGRPKTITDGSGSRTLTYDASGQLKDEDYTAGLLDTLGVHRTFDALSRLDSVSVPSVYSVGYSYDAASRLDTVTQGTNTATYGYVPNSSLVQMVTFAQGGTPRLTTTKAYDNLNRSSSITNTPSVSSVFSVVYSYNSANQRTKAVREDSAHWDYGYDALGQVTSGKKFDSTDAALPGHDFGWTYDDIGNRKTSTVNSQSTTYTPNNLNHYSQRTVSGAVDVLGAAATSATVTVSLNGGAPQTTTRNGELFFKQLAVDNSTAAQNPSIKITGVKNGVGASGEDAVTEVTKTAFLSQTPESFTHDSDGNLTDDARWHYTWDGENRLIAMETAAGTHAPNGPLPATARQKLEFGYDGQSRRIAKKVYDWDGAAWVLGTSTRFLYDGWNLLADLNALNNNAVVCSYVWGLDMSGSLQGAGGVGGLLFSTLNSQPSTHATAFDGNGNVIGLVDMATGTMSATYDYNPFGETIKSDGVAATANHFRFSTKYTDDETGLLYYGLRYYSPTIGRWPSRDPIEERGGINLYGMVGNNPTTSVDVMGLWKLGVHKQITEEAFLGLSCSTCCDKEKLLKGLKDGSIDPDIPDGFVGTGLFFIDVESGLFSDEEIKKQYGNWTSYRSHYGDLQWWHAMQSNESSAAEIQQKIIGSTLDRAFAYKVNSDEGDCGAAGRVLGFALHTIEDSYSKSHVLRNGDWSINRFQNYGQQNSHKHGEADKEKGSAEYQKAVEAVRKLLNIIICQKGDPAAIRQLLQNEVLLLSPNASVGGTNPSYQK